MSVCKVSTPKAAQLTTWGFLGLGVLASYYFLVCEYSPKVQSLWYGTPEWVQIAAYVCWGLAAMGLLIYAGLSSFSWPRTLILSFLLLASIGWSVALILKTKTPKWVTMGVLVLVALASLSLVGYETFVAKSPWYMVLCLVPLLFVNTVLDAGVWNYMYFKNA